MTGFLIAFAKATGLKWGAGKFVDVVGELWDRTMFGPPREHRARLEGSGHLCVRSAYPVVVYYQADGNGR